MKPTPTTSPQLLQSGLGWEAWYKPEYMTVHNESPSLLEYFKEHHPNKETHFLNRLDRDTSGIVIVVTDPSRMVSLQATWQSEDTQKIYVGMHRRFRDYVFEPQTWEDPISDKAEGRKNPQGLTDQRVAARTRMTPVAETLHNVLSVLQLDTGRQHQIRKHASLHRMELVGDTRYGDLKYYASLKKHVGPLRLGLHAIYLRWNPDSTPVVVNSPLPEFFTAIFPEAETKVAAAIATLIP